MDGVAVGCQSGEGTPVPITAHTTCDEAVIELNPSILLTVLAVVALVELLGWIAGSDRLLSAPPALL